MTVTKFTLLTVSKVLKTAAFYGRLLFYPLKFKIILTAVIMLLTADLSAQISGLSISLKGNYTSTSRYYPSTIGISSSNYENYYSLDDLLGYGAEFRYAVTDHIVAGLSAEMVSGSVDHRHASLPLPMKSGFDMFLFESNGYYYIPLSGESFKFYIGGGINLAKGNSYEELPSIKSEIISSPVNIGIQALSGIEYFFRKNISLRWEMKFRDPLVENQSKFASSKINYMGKTFNISTNPFKSKINIDGIVFDFSIAYYFF